MISLSGLPLVKSFILSLPFVYLLYIQYILPYPENFFKRIFDFVLDKKQKKLYNCSVVRTGCGSVWLERLLWEQDVAGSNPVTPTTKSRAFQARLFQRFLNFRTSHENLKSRGLCVNLTLIYFVSPLVSSRGDFFIKIVTKPRVNLL